MSTNRDYYYSASVKSGVNEADIQALIDNELTPPQARTVMTALARTPEQRRRYQILKNQKMLLQRWWQLYHTLQ